MSNKPPKVRASLIEIFKRFIPVGKEDNQDVYWNGEDNLYPSEIEGIILNSPTAFRAATLFAKFIGGRGVLDENGLLRPYKDLPFVNEKKGYKITDIIRMSATDIAYQYGCWFHIGYGINEDGVLYQKNLDVLPYPKCRKAKEDDDKNEGKIFFKDYCEKSSRVDRKKKETKWFYPYNPNRDVVMAQIKKDAGKVDDLETALKKYRGQVFYLNLTPQFIYALSRFDSVYNDADTEYRMGLYTNNETRSGFLGKTLVVTQGLDVEKAKEIDEDLGNWLGAENSGSLYHIDVDQADDITKVVHTVQLKAQFDDKLFEVSDKRIRRNILGAANNIPEAMVSAGDGALFGTQSETYKEMKIFYSEQVEEEREKLQETLSFLGFPVIIEPIAKREENVSEPA